MSLNHYINFLLNSTAKKEEVLFDEIINKPEKKEVESRIFFTKSEVEVLKKYADLNEWSVAKEIRYRTVSTLAKKPRLNSEELKAIYSVRSAINILGANLNRLIRDNQVISDHNIIICKELARSIEELQKKINWLIKCSNTHVWTSLIMQEKNNILIAKKQMQPCIRLIINKLLSKFII